MSDAYAPDKALLYPDRIDAIRAGTVPPPVHVQIILSDWCNQNCHFCAYRMDGYTSNEMFGVETAEGRDNNPRRFMPLEKAKEIIDDCAAMGVKAVQFTGGGEPTMYRQWQEVIAYAQDRGLATALVTNGTWLPEEADGVLLRMAWIRISLDAGDSETYGEIRQTPPSGFHKALGNLSRLSRKRGYGKTPTLGVGFVMTPQNWLGVVDATKLAKANGADNIRIGAMFSQDDAEPYHAIRGEAGALTRFAEAFATPDFRVINRFDEKLGELRDGRPTQKLCGYQHFTTYIGADQNVYRCCVYAYHPHGLLGSVKDQRFAEFWRGEENAGRLLGFDGRECERCQFTKINATIGAAVGREDSLHDGFV